MLEVSGTQQDVCHNVRVMCATGFGIVHWVSPFDFRPVKLTTLGFLKKKKKKKPWRQKSITCVPTEDRKIFYCLPVTILSMKPNPDSESELTQKITRAACMCALQQKLTFCWRKLFSTIVLSVFICVHLFNLKISILSVLQLIYMQWNLLIRFAPMENFFMWQKLFWKDHMKLW